MRLLKFIVGIALIAAICIFAARIIWPLPDRSKIVLSNAIPLSPETRWGRILAEAGAAHPGKTGVSALATGYEALISRLLLIKTAESSIDLQYYIWNEDGSGKQLLRSLLEASKRGVRVRILIDDNGVDVADSTLVSLDALENFEIRLFNPSTVRSPRMLGYTFDFFRMNRRMHNKAFIVDGAAAIVGGRNIGDEYFAVGDVTPYHDLDVLAAGAVVPQTVENFDDFWNSESVYPVSLIVRDQPGDLPDWLTGPDLADVGKLKQSVAAAVESGKRELEWTDVVMVSDDPSKGLGKATDEQLMTHRLSAVIGPVKKSLMMISAYFVPGKEGVEFLSRVRRGGADVAVMTNAYGATDVPVVHSGYVKYREQMLESGVELLEMKPMAGMVRGSDELSFTGSSGSSLHAKTLSIDDDRIFIGSFNFDPRSTYLNCEMGFLIASQSMATQMRSMFQDQFIKSSYKVLYKGGHLEWADTASDGAQKIYTTEPETTIVDRILLKVVGWLPIEWLL